MDERVQIQKPGIERRWPDPLDQKALGEIMIDLQKNPTDTSKEPIQRTANRRLDQALEVLHSMLRNYPAPSSENALLRSTHSAEELETQDEKERESHHGIIIKSLERLGILPETSNAMINRERETLKQKESAA